MHNTCENAGRWVARAHRFGDDSTVLDHALVGFRGWEGWFECRSARLGSRQAILSVPCIVLEDERHVVGRAVRYHPHAVRSGANPLVTLRGQFAEDFPSGPAELSVAAFVVLDKLHTARRAVAFISGTCGRCSEPLLLRPRLRARRTSEVGGNPRGGLASEAAHLARRGFAEDFVSVNAVVSVAALVVLDKLHTARRAVAFISGTCGRCSEPLLLRPRLRARRTSEVGGNPRGGLASEAAHRVQFAEDFVSGPAFVSVAPFVVLDELHAARRAVAFISGTPGRCSEPLLVRRGLQARRTSEVRGNPRGANLASEAAHQSKGKEEAERAHGDAWKLPKRIRGKVCVWTAYCAALEQPRGRGVATHRAGKQAGCGMAGKQAGCGVAGRRRVGRRAGAEAAAEAGAGAEAELVGPPGSVRSCETRCRSLCCNRLRCNTSFETSQLEKHLNLNC